MYLSVTTEALDESAVVNAVLAFANGAELPDFLRGLPGDFEPMSGVRAVDRLTGETVAQGVPARREQLRADLEAIASGKLTRVRLQDLEVQADRITKETKGLRRRPVFIRTPDLQAALGYVTFLIAKRAYGKRLARCRLTACRGFFLREPRRARPESYCSPDCATEGKQAASRQRSQKARNKKAAVDQLRKEFPSSAERLVEAVAEDAFTVDEFVKRARAYGARKHRQRG